MNTTNCPQGWATDKMFYFENADNACDLLVSAWFGTMSTIVILKFTTAVMLTALWIRRQQRAESKVAARRSKNRWPLVPMILWLMIVPYFVATVLSVIIPEQIGLALPFLYGCGWFLYGLYFFSYLAKFISLGYRIIPRKHQALLNEDKNTLEKVNLILGLGIISAAIALLGQTFVLCVGSLVYPNQYLVIRIGAGFNAWFMFQGASIAVYQLNRVLQV
jgi:hypothetical protein